MKLGEKLKYYRQKNGYSQDDIAKKLNISRQAISRWENGWNMPDLENIVVLCDLYGLTTDELLKSEEPDPVIIEPDPAPKRTFFPVEFKDEIFYIALMIAACFFSFLGVFIGVIMLFLWVKNKKYSYVLLICCILSILANGWTTWSFLNALFFNLGGEATVEKVALILNLFRV